MNLLCKFQKSVFHLNYSIVMQTREIDMHDFCFILCHESIKVYVNLINKWAVKCIYGIDISLILKTYGKGYSLKYLTEHFEIL